jgi:glycosyltransferase involved in cell wall biosynthesis
MEKVRVAFIASTFKTGGAENVMAELITRLSRDRFERRVFFLRNPGPVGSKLLGGGVPGEARVQKHRFDPRVLWRLRKLLREYAPHIAFCLDHRNAMLWGRLSSLLAGVPRRVVASHSTGRMNGRRSFTRLDRVLMKATDSVVALSERHAGYLSTVENVDPGKLVIIENGIDVPRYEHASPESVAALRDELGISKGERVVVMVASLRPEKAHEALLEAAQALAGETPVMRFLIVGDGPRRSHLEALRVRLALGDRVIFTGKRDDIPELLHLADVLVLPSHAAVETLPLAVLEAMAAGVPVVASAVGSVPDLIEDGVNGRLIAPASAGGLTEAIRSIMNDPKEAENLAARAKTTVSSKYTADLMVAKYEALFRRLIN